MNKPINITSLQKKGRYFYISINKNEKIKFHPDIFLEYAINSDSCFDNEEWEKIKYKNSYRLAWECALRLLSARAHCERDLSNKLRQRKFKKQIIQAVIEECKRLDFIDDIKFAREYIRELIEKGSGIKLIRAKLIHKGVAGESVEKCIEDSISKDDELQAARLAYRKKTPALKKESDPRKKREKLYRYMLSKGFSYDIIQAVISDDEDD